MPASAILTDADELMPRQSEKQPYCTETAATGGVRRLACTGASAPSRGIPDHGGRLASSSRRAARRKSRSRDDRTPANLRRSTRSRSARGSPTSSKTPGRTQHINFFRLRSGALLADLPGIRLCRGAGSDAPPLAAFHCALSRRARAADRACPGHGRAPSADRLWTGKMLDWFLPSGRPVHILLTKADKLRAASAAAHARQTRAQHC